VAEKFPLNRDQLADLFLLSGLTTILPTLPEVETQSTSVTQRIKSTVALLSKFNYDGHALCVHNKDEDYLAAYKKAKFAIRHHVTITEDGRVLPQNDKHAPNDVHEFMSWRLPGTFQICDAI
jgi:hypothetical protein